MNKVYCTSLVSELLNDYKVSSSLVNEFDRMNAWFRCPQN